MTKADLTLIDHPLIQHKLTLMRDENTAAAVFRQLLREIAHLMAYEVLRDLPLDPVQITTPLETIQSPKLAGKKLCFISILRAGNGLLEGMLDLVPSARVGHVGLYRDPETLRPVEYYKKFPRALEDRPCILLERKSVVAGKGVGLRGRRVS